MCPRSGFWYRGTSECTLVLAFGTGEHPNVRFFRFWGSIVPVFVPSFPFCSSPEKRHKRKTSPKRKFSGRISRGHPGVIRVDIPAQNFGQGPGNPGKTSIWARTAMTRRCGHPRPQGIFKNFGQKNFGLNFRSQKKGINIKNFARTPLLHPPWPLQILCVWGLLSLQTQEKSQT